MPGTARLPPEMLAESRFKPQCDMGKEKGGEPGWEGAAHDAQQHLASCLPAQGLPAPKPEQKAYFWGVSWSGQHTLGMRPIILMPSWGTDPCSHDGELRTRGPRSAGVTPSGSIHCPGPATPWNGGWGCYWTCWPGTADRVPPPLHTWPGLTKSLGAVSLHPPLEVSQAPFLAQLGTLKQPAQVCCSRPG